ncbi:DUF2306 domain-containing protein [Maribacter sp. 2308TA10-17]|uniref:DUF2306 domain-containing protein n=1 Tax=Maribacter sp. 2308TA10-17 TaxID=3386276 RepID=UPI0039BC2604
MIHSTIGLIHTICATVALLTGTFVLLTTKGNRLHVRVGYVYVVAMLAMNFTGFGIYHLFGGFGIFHVMILVSLFALFGGMYPILFRNKVKNWYLQHIEVMSWSIVGLYAAFVAEVGVRFLPLQYMMWVVGAGSGLVCTMGSILIKRKLKKEKELIELKEVS